MSKMHNLVVGLVTALPIGCANEGSDAPRLAVDIAALSLDGVGDVVWDIEVLDPSSTRVWAKRVSSSAFGDSNGSASYVGPCDASTSNTVRVWVVGLYASDVTSAGDFAAGSTVGVVGTPMPFENPTATGPLTRTVTCAANTDTPVRFDVTLMRGAEQGFFDVAVDFRDVFCSAKLDCSGDDLLFDASGQRVPTFVLGFACTAGPDAAVDTALFMDTLELDCDGLANGFAPSLTIDPARGSGNLCVAGDVSSCLALTSASTVDADTYLHQVAAYRGSEVVQSGGVSANVVYWNVALGVKPAISACRLRTRATGDDDADDSDTLVDGVITAGAVSPYVQWDVDLGACASEPLTFDPSASVHTTYSGTSDAISFDRGFGETRAAGCPSGVCAESVPGDFTTVADACPSGWTDLGPSGLGQGRAGCTAADCRLCQAPTGSSTVPASTTFLMASCPASWTSLGASPLTGQASATCPSTACQLCQTPAATTQLPTNATMLAATCPSGWTDLATTPIAGQVQVHCGTTPCHVCAAP